GRRDVRPARPPRDPVDRPVGARGAAGTRAGVPARVPARRHLERVADRVHRVGRRRVRRGPAGVDRVRGRLRGRRDRGEHLGAGGRRRAGVPVPADRARLVGGQRRRHPHRPHRRARHAGAHAVPRDLGGGVDLGRGGRFHLAEPGGRAGPVPRRQHPPDRGGAGRCRNPALRHVRPHAERVRRHPRGRLLARDAGLPRRPVPHRRDPRRARGRGHRRLRAGGLVTRTDLQRAEPKPTGVLSGGSPRVAALFLTPALLLVVVFLVYPTAYSLVRSFFDARGTEFVGVDNYVTAFTDDRTLVALRNTVIWVLVAPSLVTTIGLVLAVLTERIRWATAFRLVMFMPLAISLVASGIIFRLVYEEDPDRGVVNAVLVSVHDAFAPAAPYAGARPREGGGLVAGPDGDLVSAAPVGPRDAVGLAITGFDPADLPPRAAPAVLPEPGEGLRGLVWLDVGGTPDRTGEV